MVSAIQSTTNTSSSGGGAAGGPKSRRRHVSGTISSSSMTKNVGTSLEDVDLSGPPATTTTTMTRNDNQEEDHTPCCSASGTTNAKHTAVTPATTTTTNRPVVETIITEEEDFYDDDDSIDGDGNKKMYKKSCPLGKFMLNPCACLISTMTSSCHNNSTSNTTTTTHDTASSFPLQQQGHHRQNNILQRMVASYCPRRITSLPFFVNSHYYHNKNKNHYYQTKNHPFRQRRQGIGQSSWNLWIDLLLLGTTVLCLGVCFWYLILPVFRGSSTTTSSTISRTTSTSTSWRHRHRRPQFGRPNTDDEVNQLDIVIPRFSTNYQYDLGGWMTHRTFYFPSPPPDPYEENDTSLHYDYDTEHVEREEEPRTLTPDYGGLAYVYLSNRDIRDISPIDETRYENYRDQLLITKDKSHMSSEYVSAEDLEAEGPSTCQRPNWKQLYSPTCNDIHSTHLEIDFQVSDGEVEHDGAGHAIQDTSDLDSFYISHGYYRDVWVLSQPDVNLKSILKKARWKFDYTINTLHATLRDALIMERLQKSPRIIDLYSHCGTSVWVEAIPYEVEEYIVPGDGFIKQEDLHDQDELQPQNEYNIRQKLDMALEMAESLADLHGFQDGVIVHDDVQLCQWLRQRNGKLKLGDFNRAEIMDFDTEKQEYCKYVNGHGYGNYRAPEEFAAKELDEKIDVFSMGNNIYALLTGLWVFYENEDDQVVQKKLIDGELAYVDPRYEAHSYAEGRLVDIMRQCWEYDPAKRIDIFEVIRLLRGAVKENARQEALLVKNEQ